MIAPLLGVVANAVLARLVPDVGDLADKYLRREITRDELDARVREAVLTTVAEVEVTHAQELTKTYSRLLDSVDRNGVVRVAWAVVLYSQLLILTWHQVGIPALVYLTGERYPSSGTSVEWAYALVAFCVGAGPVVLRTGPGAGLVDRLRSIIK